MNRKIVKGIESIRPNLIGKRIFLVKDSSFEFLGIKSFFDGFSICSFSDITPNPLYEQVCKGVELFNREGCDLIVAVGGGSTIDVAKCIKLYCKMNPKENYLRQPCTDTGVLLIAVPTTAGTGSESTRHAVIYFEGAKQSISHPSIVPDIAVLEPSVLGTLPVYQKKCTMLDALCQGIESWWSLGSTDESKAYCRKAVEAIRDNWQAYIEDNSPAAAEKIMEAANYSGRAINITATTAAHAMSYNLTSMFGLPHGHAAALCLAPVWRYMLSHGEKCVDPRGRAYLEGVLSEIPVSVSFMQELLCKLGMSNPVSENREADINALVASVNPVRLKNNPVGLDREALTALYKEIVK